jgi:hypothetical protein
MIQVLHTIKMRGGEQVELLATPALFAIARKRGMTIEADSDNVAEVFSAYTRLLYLAALNAWDVRRYDNPSMGECPYTLMDFVEWSSNDKEGFVEAISFALAALTGKELKDYATGEAKDPETGEKSPNTEDEGKGVKKKSASGWITRLLRRSS